MSPEFDHHMDLMRLVFSRMREARLSIKMVKCQLFNNRVDYLGHVLTLRGLEVADHHIQAIRNFPSSKSKKECRRLNGLFWYYRRFVDGYARVIRPILNLTKKEVPFEWTEEHEEAKKTLI